MARRASNATRKDERKITVISLCDDLIELCDKLDCENAQSLSADYADDEPRKKAVRAIDDLHRGLYGTLSERQHAQVTHIMQLTCDQEKLDRENDRLKQEERTTITQIKDKARKLRNEHHAS